MTDDSLEQPSPLRVVESTASDGTAPTHDPQRDYITALEQQLAANEAVIQEQLKEHCRDRKELLSEIEQLQARVKELEGKQ